ncbi:MAG TPA: hypothetical protein VF751_01790, partial [Chthoniobacterales bacterium]
QPFAALKRNEIGKNLPVQSLLDQSKGAVEPAFAYKLSNNTTSFRVNAPKAGVIALGENYVAGDFDVTLNGKPAPYFRINEVFKGVIINQAGTYDVSVRYWPRGFTFVLLLFGTGMAALAGYLLFFLRIHSASPAVIALP